MFYSYSPPNLLRKLELGYVDILISLMKNVYHLEILLAHFKIWVNMYLEQNQKFEKCTSEYSCEQPLTTFWAIFLLPRSNYKVENKEKNNNHIRYLNFDTTKNSIHLPSNLKTEGDDFSLIIYLFCFSILIVSPEKSC